LDLAGKDTSFRLDVLALAVLMTLAGTPMDFVRGGKSRVTTAPAPTMDDSPMATPLRTKSSKRRKQTCVTLMYEVGYIYPRMQRASGLPLALRVK
jgi:hypothetical protein